MSLIKVQEFFKQYNLSNKIIKLNASTATVKEAAEALKCEEKMIAKSLSFKVNDRIVMILTAGNAKISNSKYKEKFNTKANMLKPDEVQKYIGHEIGGVCPFGIDESIEVYLDISLKELEYMYPACGENHTAICLSRKELEKYSNYKEYIDVCKSE